MVLKVGSLNDWELMTRLLRCDGEGLESGAGDPETTGRMTSPKGVDIDIDITRSADDATEPLEETKDEEVDGTMPIGVDRIAEAAEGAFAVSPKEYSSSSSDPECDEWPLKSRGERELPAG